MPAPVNRAPNLGGAEASSPVVSRWRTRISREQERRVYFLATVVLAAWYLMTHAL